MRVSTQWNDPRDPTEDSPGGDRRMAYEHDSFTLSSDLSCGAFLAARRSSKRPAFPQPTGVTGNSNRKEVR